MKLKCILIVTAVNLGYGLNGQAQTLLSSSNSIILPESSNKIENKMVAANRSTDFAVNPKVSNLDNIVKSNANSNVAVEGLGIGTQKPLARLDVTFRSNENTPHLMLFEENESNGAKIEFKNAGSLNTWDVKGTPAINDGNASLNFNYSSQGNVMTLSGMGNVGIGVSNPNYKLDVKGTMRAEELIVETNWADYVFEENYNLTELKEIEKFIKINKHLPGVPSAKQIQENGASISKLMTVMMSKIEELTLHSIEQEKEIQNLKHMRRGILNRLFYN